MNYTETDRAEAYAEARELAFKLSECNPEDLATQSFLIGQLTGTGMRIYEINAELDGR